MIANLRVGLETVSQVGGCLTFFLGEKRVTDEIKELKKEIIRLKSLNRRAADEIRDLDDTIIKITKKFPEVREFLGWKDDDLWAGESSINLLNRLDGRTKGGYVENYEDLHLEMQTLDGYAQIEHPDFYRKQEHPPECKWHKDWHACDCRYFDKVYSKYEEDWKCPTCGDPDFNHHHDED